MYMDINHKIPASPVDCDYSVLKTNLVHQMKITHEIFILASFHDGL